MEGAVAPLVIIQPDSWDRVQSGVWYKGIWLYSSAMKRGLDAYLYEDADIFTVDEAFATHGHEARYVINLSSYPQLDMVRQLHRERALSHDLRFMGLDPLLQLHGLGPLVDAGDYSLDFAEGAFELQHVGGALRHRHFDDYDGHLRELDDGRPWEPAFFGVGCDRRCGYCYVGYTSFPSGFATVPQMEAIVRHAADEGYNLHFYDEDFFRHPELEAALSMLTGSGVKWIALATSVTLSEAITKYGAERIVRAGNVLNEVGVETADPAVLDKRQDLQTLHGSGIKVFWLTVTFFPKETLTSRYRTGQFLKSYGYGFDQLMPRLVGNSSAGGLGQFYVPYHGTPWYEKAIRNGYMLEARPTRLWPGYVPHSFIEDIPVQTGEDIADKRWFDIYPGVAGCWSRVLDKCNGHRRVGEVCGTDQTGLIAMAQLAQLGLVRSARQ